ncbi:hypothetical protein [Armatimonas sp.]|uniref:hypothetical protein n=1 Tax=Armatimonas sp. TaxID=1872638 RepID=UPI00286C730C|nr:hypothetical protein [Armatimonas sp.]
MESPRRLAESLLSLTERLKQALEQGQMDLLATLLAERQALLQSLGQMLQKGDTLSDELVQALQESDSEFLQTVEVMHASLGRELANHQEQQRVSFVYRTSAHATFLDQLG